MKLYYSPAQDQGTAEIIEIVKEIRSEANIEVTKEWPDYYVVESDDETISMLMGAIDMIALLSPGGKDVTNKHEALGRLQQLVYGNLKSIEPPLGPFIDK